MLRKVFLTKGHLPKEPAIEVSSKLAKVGFSKNHVCRRHIGVRLAVGIKSLPQKNAGLPTMIEPPIINR
jgi:hypothetical protein